MNAIREWFGFWLIERALRVLPVSSSTRVAMIRGLREQRAYDRYEAYCELQRTKPVSFARWRELAQFFKLKCDSAEQANAVLRASGRPAFRPQVSHL